MKSEQQYIEIKDLAIWSYIGVPAAERAVSQQLKVTIKVTAPILFEEMSDNMVNSIDYYQLSEQIKLVALAKPRQLIETLAADIARHIFVASPAIAVEIFLKKYILPNTTHVGVHATYTR